MQTSQEIELQGTLSIAELTRFQYFHTLRRTWPIVVVVALFLFVVVPSVGLVVLAHLESDWRPILTNAIPFMLLLLFWVLVMGVLPYRNARKQFASQISLRERISYTFNPESVSCKGQSVSWSMAWNVLQSVRETKSLFLLYHHRQVAVVVPKRFFSNEAEMATWRELVLTSVALKQIEPPGIVGQWC